MIYIFLGIKNFILFYIICLINITVCRGGGGGGGGRGGGGGGGGGGRGGRGGVINIIY